MLVDTLIVIDNKQVNGKDEKWIETKSHPDNESTITKKDIFFMSFLGFLFASMILAAVYGLAINALQS